MNSIIQPEELEKKLDQAVSYLRSRGIGRPEVAVILGSGLGSYGDRLESPLTIPYNEIPGFVTSTAPSHRGVLLAGECQGKEIIVLSGRFHYYEGYAPHELVFPVRVMARLGVRRLIITNAVGGITMPQGSLALVSDHINMSGMNPLIGPNDDALGPRFPDISDLYSRNLRTRLLEAAEKVGIPLREGVYIMTAGPSYESPAEIRAYRTLGADVVGMSCVPEALAAGHAGLEVLALSCVTNAAAGLSKEELTAEEVTTTAASLACEMEQLIDIAVAL